jgi:hypothetical protein
MKRRKRNSWWSENKYREKVETSRTSLSSKKIQLFL